MRKSIYLLLLIFIFCSCKERSKTRTVNPVFYHWQTVFDLTTLEIKKLDSLKVKTIYLRMFDVSWDQKTHEALPISKIIANGNFLAADYIIIPTIFITDECIFNLKKTDIDSLAKNIVRQIDISYSYLKSNNFDQIQIDCDWTKSSKDTYFALLNSLHNRLPGKILSATIRLHQIKYASSTGIPPVDRGMLMCYNMGNLRNPATSNSILDVKETEKYLGSLSSYSLPLDVALPLFDWVVVFRNEKFKGLIQDNQDDYRCFPTQSASSISIVQRDTVINGITLLKNDRLRFEKSNYKDIVTVSKILSKKIKTDSLSLAFYHLDSLTLSKFNVHELENICNSLR